MKKNLLSLKLLRIKFMASVMLFLIFTGFGSSLLGQSVNTDYLDYAPGDYVQITGSGWSPDETVSLLVVHQSGWNMIPADTVNHKTWNVVADNNGNFSSQWYVSDYELGATLILTAKGNLSGFTYEVFFSDANAQTRINSISPSSGTCGNTITVSATLQYKSGNNWINFQNQVLSFTIGTATVSATTSSDGVASTPLAVPGNNPTSLQVNYAGTSGYQSANGSIAFTWSSTLGSTGSITGLNAVCPGSTGINYFIAPVTNATDYLWSVPPGSTISSGQGTNSINVIFGSQGGTITCTPGNACGSGTQALLNIALKPLPGPAGSVNGSNKICAPETNVTYTVSPVSNATSYHWTVPAGGTIVDGENTNSIKVNYSVSAATGTVSVCGVNECGNGSQSDLPISIHATPEAPSGPGLQTFCSISPAPKVDDLKTTGGENIKWYDSSGNLLNGSNNLADGAHYFASQTVDGCESISRLEVTVILNSLPKITGNKPVSTIVNTDPGLCSAKVNYSTPTVEGIPEPEWHYSLSGVTSGSGSGTGSGSTFNKGVTNVTITALNSCGTDTWNFSVTVNDNQAPVTPENGSSVVTCSSLAVAPSVPVAVDYCDGNISGVLESTANSPDPLVCQGTRTFTYSYTDAAKNVSYWTYTYTVTRSDFSIPATTDHSTVLCASSALPGNVTLPVVKSDCGETLTPGNPVTNKGQTDTYNSCEGTISYTWTYTDCAGNAHDWTYTYTVTPDDFSIPETTNHSTVSCASSAVSGNVTLPVVKSDCGETLTPENPVTNKGQTDTYNSCEGTISYTWTYTDCAGHAHDWTYTYTVSPDDFSIPETTNHSTVSCASSAVSGNVTLPVVKSDCGETLTPGNPVTNKGQTDTYNGCEGTVSYTWTYTDCAGHAHDWIYTYTVSPDDFSIPEITNHSTVSCASSAVSGNVTLPVVKSGCGETLTPGNPVTNKGQTDTYNGCEGTVSYTWTYTDCAGHAHDWTYTYTVTRNDFSIPETLDHGTVECESSALAESVTLPVVKADCGEILTPGDPVTNKGKTDTYDGCKGTISYTWTYKDCAGHTHDWTYTYTVFDVSAPVVNVKNPVVTLDMNGNASITVDDVNNGSYDNCNGTLKYSLSQTSFTCADIPGKVVTLNVTDCTGNQNSNNATVTVNQRESLIENLGVFNGQYSDPVTLQARLTDKLTGTPLAGKTIAFTIGSQSTTGLTGTNGIATGTIILNQSPDGSYFITSTFSGNCPYNGSDDKDAFTIICENVAVTYNGGETFTVNPNTFTGTVSLSASVVDNLDPNSGDIRNATVTFIDNQTGSTLGTPDTPVGLINSNILTEGFATTDLVYKLSNSDISLGGKIWEVVPVVRGYYCGQSSYYTPVTLTVPGPDYVTGGGHLTLGSGTSGTYAGTPGKNMNFGLVMKWNKSGKNLQGNINIIYRGINGFNYQIKSNAINSLAINTKTIGSATYKIATITTKANFKLIYPSGQTDPVTGLGYKDLGGNLTLIVTAWDCTTDNTGKSDKIAVQLAAPSGSGIWFSSNWVGGTTNNTVEQILTGGSINVGSANSSNARTAEFGVKVYPNPFHNSVTFELQLKTDSKVRLEIFNIDGSKISTVYDDMVVAYDRYQFEYSPGSVSDGMLIYRLIVDGQLMFTGKLIRQ